MFSEQLVLFDSLGFLMYPDAFIPSPPPPPKSVSKTRMIYTANDIDSEAAFGGFEESMELFLIRDDAQDDPDTASTECNHRDKKLFTQSDLRRFRNFRWILSLARDIYHVPLNASAVLAGYIPRFKFGKIWLYTEMLKYRLGMTTLTIGCTGRQEMI
jgi:hypothetical protein